MPSFDQVAGTGLSVGGQVSHGLNLTLELKNPLEMPLLLAGIALKLTQTREALKELHFVHFARFLPVRHHTALLVITSFDGPLKPYVLDFAITIGDIFDLILGFVKEHPPLPVRDHPREFMEFVELNNRVVVVPPDLVYYDDYPLYSAYPDRTVIDILGPRTGLPPTVTNPQPAKVDLADVQGNILRGYGAKVARHYALRIGDANAARTLLSKMVDGDGSVCPRITSAQTWDADKRPPYFLNVGFTADGLKALGVPKETLAKFAKAFIEGPAQSDRAEANGDIGASAPIHWELGGFWNPSHLLVSLYADANGAGSEFERRDKQLAGSWAPGGLCIVVVHDAAALADDKVHFGYVEGMAQPHIAGITDDAGPDMQPQASVGEFLLGDAYAGIYGGKSLGDLPKALCQNSTFAAVRVLDQDVAAFEKLLDDASQVDSVDREFVAAKIMGRWRNGTPLLQRPAAPPGIIAPAGAQNNYNEFDYAPSHAFPLTANDHEGLRCPVGAHVRRMNPRSALVAGKPYSRRIIRRGMPYGPVWDSADPSARRGLYGIFVCADLERQFEFLMQQWANGDIAASGIRGTQDPIIGKQDNGGIYRIPMAGGADPIKLTVPRLVTTRGGLYLFVPGLGGLRHLAKGEGFAGNSAAILGPRQWLIEKGATQAAAEFDPTAFDPKDPHFLADPYPYYALFRQRSPVALVKHGGYKSYWVFSHRLVTEVCGATDRFLKRPIGEKGARGLFYMDPPRHGSVRQILAPLFAASIANSAAQAVALAAEAIDTILAKGQNFDLISQYSNLVTRNVFMTMFGIPRSEWEGIGRLVDTILNSYDQMLPWPRRLPAAAASASLLAYFLGRQIGCPAVPTSPELLCQMQSRGVQAGMTGDEVRQTALHFALGGYLSTDFLIGTGIHNLLSQPGAMAAYRSASAVDRLNAIEEMKRFDAPFQMADRYAAEDTQLGGCQIPAGAMVTVVYGSANRDESVFGGDAGVFDIARNPLAGANYVFGHGIHYCIGAPMVAMVAPAVFDALIQAMPQLALAGSAPERVTDPYFRAFSSLQLSK